MSRPSVLAISFTDEMISSSSMATAVRRMLLKLEYYIHSKWIGHCKTICLCGFWNKLSFPIQGLLMHVRWCTIFRLNSDHSWQGPLIHPLTSFL
jgi:hypothetical protein